MKRIVIISFLLIAGNICSAQVWFKDDPFAHTYSIVAIDQETGDMGVAVQSHWFSVGTIVSWGKPGVGVVATQSLVNVSFGPKGLELLEAGDSPKEVLDKLLEEDEGREYRQVSVLGRNGEVAAFTGQKCIAEAGHQIGKGFSVQANLMEYPTVWPAMARAFESSKDLPLAERMIAALEAAEAEGGDIRGRQSAAILVVSGKPTGKIWVDRKVDIRVDDHPSPLLELKRLLSVHRAYGHMNAGDLAIEQGDFQTAMKEYAAAESMFPENIEMKFWHAINLANTGKVMDSLPLFLQVFKKEERWRKLTQRLTKNGLLTVSKVDLQKILTVK
jgi:uncharacterized Ntn-hydrolase superfamily protein